mgnify:CR=1 FL=1|tara:strand:+ start:114 stop:371 length:258 start_codon:yes stop_codon:yes gene_type:complete
MEYRIIRILTCYSSVDEKIVFDAQLEGFDLNEFQKEFGVDPCNPMYDCYEVKVANIPFLKRYLPKLVGINWDFNNYAYFVEAVEN